VAQVKETGSFHVALVAKPDEETGDQVLVVLPTVEMDIEHVEGMHLTCRIRSLGYIGPFLSQYESAQVVDRQAGGSATQNSWATAGQVTVRRKLASLAVHHSQAGTVGELLRWLSHETLHAPVTCCSCSATSTRLEYFQLRQKPCCQSSPTPPLGGTLLRRATHWCRPDLSRQVSWVAA
jgi:hypothetical protein